MLVLPARLAHAQAPACVRMLAQALRSEPQQVVVDASALEQFDSSALAVLLECRRESLAHGKGFHVVNLPPRLRELASVYGVGELLSVPPAQPNAGASAGSAAAQEATT